MGTPALLCLNLRLEDEALASETPEVFARIAFCLEQARLRSWVIAHFIHASRRSKMEKLGPLPGFEPLASEIVLSLTHAAAFESQAVLDAFNLYDTPRFYVIGGAYSREGLATIVSASEQKKHVTLIGDACMRPPGRDNDGWGPSILSFLSPPQLELDLSERVFGGTPADIINLAERRGSRGS